MPLKAKDTNYLRCPIVGSFETVNEIWMLGTRVLYSISNKYSSKPSLPWSHEFNKNSIKICDTEVGYNLQFSTCPLEHTHTRTHTHMNVFVCEPECPSRINETQTYQIFTSGTK